MDPVGGAVAGAVEARGFAEGFEQHRPRAIAPLPVRRQLAGCQPQRVTRQVRDLHPRKQQEAWLADHEVEVLLVLPGRPADPLIAASQRAARLAEQHTAQAGARAGRAGSSAGAGPAAGGSRGSGAGSMNSFQSWVSSCCSTSCRHSGCRARRLVAISGWGAVRAVAATGCRGPGRMFCVCLGGSVRMAACSSCSSRPRAAANPVAASGRAPVEVLADRLRQLLAAQGRERGHRLLDIGDLPAREASAEEGSGLELLDAGVHDSHQGTCSWLPSQIRGSHVKGVVAIPSRKSASAFESTHWRSAEKSRFRLAYFSAIGAASGCPDGSRWTKSTLAGREKAAPGRSLGKKALVAVAAEEDGAGTGRTSGWKRVADASAASLEAFVLEAVEPGSVIRTDGWPSYSKLHALGYRHETSVTGGDPSRTDRDFPRVHRVASLLKRWLLGTHQGAVEKKHFGTTTSTNSPSGSTGGLRVRAACCFTGCCSRRS